MNQGWPIKPEAPLQTGQVLNDLAGFVHSTIVGGAVDGPGMRFVLFTSGCQMRCQYCHNPDTWNKRGGELRTVGDVVAEVGQIAPFLKATGGITVSGGEPLVQADFVHEVLLQCKAKYGLHTALDTNGELARNLPDDWFDDVDLVLLDIKHIDPIKHLKLTHAPLQPVLDFAKRLADIKKPVWIRYVLVPGYTDGFDDIVKLADFVVGLGNIERVEILPFHKMGEYKWKELGLPYRLDETGSPASEIIEQAKQLFAQYGLSVVV